MIVASVRKKNAGIYRNGDNELLTYSDLQRILNIGPDRAYQLLRSPSFPTIRINNRYYVRRGSLMKWLELYEGRTFLV